LLRRRDGLAEEVVEEMRLFGAAPPERIDEASSARWFDGWRRLPGGLIDPAEVPGGA
jgi:hypothetical protein